MKMLQSDWLSFRTTSCSHKVVHEIAMFSRLSDVSGEHLETKGKTAEKTERKIFTASEIVKYIDEQIDFSKPIGKGDQ